jgi:excisionase family DNA binding protein
MEDKAKEELLEALRRAIGEIEERNRLGMGLVGRNAAARLLGVSVRTLRRMELRGELTAVRVGCSVKYRRAEIERIVGGEQ